MQQDNSFIKDWLFNSQSKIGYIPYEPTKSTKEAIKEWQNENKRED